jgi:hypothetical protein
MATSTNDPFVTAALASSGLTPETVTADQMQQIQQAEAAVASQAQTSANTSVAQTSASNAIQQTQSQNANQDAATKAARANRQKVPVLIMGIEPSQSDIISAMACLGNMKVFYAMGQNFGECNIRGMMLLGPLANVTVDGISVLNDFFNKYRVSISQRSITISIGKQTYQFFLVTMSIGAVDSNTHTLPFMLGGVIVDPANGDLFSINPTYTIKSTLSNAATTPTTMSSSGAGATATTSALSTEQLNELDNYAIQNNLPYQENSFTQTQPPTSDQINAALVNQPNTSVVNNVANSTQAQNLQDQLNQQKEAAATPATYNYGLSSAGTSTIPNSSPASFLNTQPAPASTNTFSTTDSSYNYGLSSAGTSTIPNSSPASFLNTQPAQAQPFAPGSMFIGSTTPVSTKQ